MIYFGLLFLERPCRVHWHYGPLEEEGDLYKHYRLIQAFRFLERGQVGAEECTEWGHVRSFHLEISVAAGSCRSLSSWESMLPTPLDAVGSSRYKAVNNKITGKEITMKLQKEIYF